MKEKCQLREPALVRARVRGEHGPDRKLLPSFHQLGTYNTSNFRKLEVSVINQLASHPSDHNDITNSEVYRIAQACELKDYFTSSYQQYLLQTVGIRTEDTNSIPDEWEYTDYNDSTIEFRDLFNQFVDPHFRARIACLPAGQELGWHIDTNTSYACRVQIMIHGEHEFLIKRKGIIEQQIMRQGEVWFINTGFSHKVTVIGDEPRVGIVLGCHFAAIASQVPCSEK
jgi:quercetin dioxygenase-like cupin family protein